MAFSSENVLVCFLFCLAISFIWISNNSLSFQIRIKDLLKLVFCLVFLHRKGPWFLSPFLFICLSNIYLDPVWKNLQKHQWKVIFTKCSIWGRKHFGLVPLSSQTNIPVQREVNSRITVLWKRHHHFCFSWERAFLSVFSAETNFIKTL